MHVYVCNHQAVLYLSLSLSLSTSLSLSRPVSTSQPPPLSLLTLSRPPTLIPLAAGMPCAGAASGSDAPDSYRGLDSMTTAIRRVASHGCVCTFVCLCVPNFGMCLWLCGCVSVLFMWHAMWLLQAWACVLHLCLTLPPALPVFHHCARHEHARV